MTSASGCRPSRGNLPIPERGVGCRPGTGKNGLGAAGYKTVTVGVEKSRGSATLIRSEPFGARASGAARREALYAASAWLRQALTLRV